MCKQIDGSSAEGGRCCEGGDMSGGLNGVVWGTIQSRDVVKSSNEACNPSPYQTAHHHPANPLPPLSLSLVLAANQALELRLHLA